MVPIINQVVLPGRDLRQHHRASNANRLHMRFIQGREPLIKITYRNLHAFDIGRVFVEVLRDSGDIEFENAIWEQLVAIVNRTQSETRIPLLAFGSCSSALYGEQFYPPICRWYA